MESGVAVRLVNHSLCCEKTYCSPVHFYWGQICISGNRWKYLYIVGIHKAQCKTYFPLVPKLADACVQKPALVYMFVMFILVQVRGFWIYWNSIGFKSHIHGKNIYSLRTSSALHTLTQGFLSSPQNMKSKVIKERWLTTIFGNTETTNHLQVVPNFQTQRQ